MDWRIGRLVRSNFYSTAQFANNAVLLPQNSCRVGWTVSDAGFFGGAVAVGDSPLIKILSPNGVVLGGDMFIWAGPLHVTIATHGDLPTYSFSVAPSAQGSRNIMVIEYIAPEDVLTLGLESLRREYPGFRDFKPPAMAQQAGGIGYD